MAFEEMETIIRLLFSTFFYCGSHQLLDRNSWTCEKKKMINKQHVAKLADCSSPTFGFFGVTQGKRGIPSFPPPFYACQL